MFVVSKVKRIGLTACVSKRISLRLTHYYILYCVKYRTQIEYYIYKFTMLFLNRLKDSALTTDDGKLFHIVIVDGKK